MAKRILRTIVAACALALLPFAVAGCDGKTDGIEQAGDQTTYKCGCGKEKSVASKAAPPNC